MATVIANAVTRGSARYSHMVTTYQDAITPVLPRVIAQMVASYATFFVPSEDDDVKSYDEQRALQPWRLFLPMRHIKNEDGKIIDIQYVISSPASSTTTTTPTRPHTPSL
jgi:hypothetical protein